jgi:hypothetical protein
VAAHLLGVCLRTIDYLIASEVLKPKKIGRRTLLRYEDIRTLAAAPVTVIAKGSAGHE